MKLQQPYDRYPSAMVEVLTPRRAQKPSAFVYVNMPLIHKLNLEALLTQEGCELLSGLQSSFDVSVLALAYAGHQFGHFARLGDGRACVLGRVKGVDIALKGSGPTRFARGGDGLAPIGACIKETLYSHALQHLKIPTTKVLAITYKHEHAYREMMTPAGVLSRVMRTNIRIGTLEYAYTFLDKQAVESILTLAIEQLSPSLIKHEHPIPFFIQQCMKQWGQLCAQWQSIGFVHGVLNSDNVSLAYETIDFGPCAFLETVQQHHAFSSIDALNRYAYGNQKDIMRFNASLCVQACMSLIKPEHESMIECLNSYLRLYDEAYTNTIKSLSAQKFGLRYVEDSSLWDQWLNHCEAHHLDFTQSFVDLMYNESSLRGLSVKLDEWLQIRHDLIQEQGLSQDESLRIMKQVNPLIILRHDGVNDIINDVLSGNFERFDEVMNLLSTPYEEHVLNHPWFKPSQSKIVTTCGT